MNFEYPLATASWGEEELDGMREVIDSGMYSIGTNVQAFERDFADCMGSHYRVMVNFGSS